MFKKFKVFLFFPRQNWIKKKFKKVSSFLCYLYLIREGLASNIFIFNNYLFFNASYHSLPIKQLLLCSLMNFLKKFIYRSEFFTDDYEYIILYQLKIPENLFICFHWVNTYLCLARSSLVALHSYKYFLISLPFFVEWKLDEE